MTANNDPTDPYVFEVLCDVIAQVLDMPRDELTLDTTIDDLGMDLDDKAYDEIYRQTCARTGKDLSSVMAAMPSFAPTAGLRALASLRNLATFSNRAHVLLVHHVVRRDIETLGSVAQSIAAEGYVPSGKPIHNYLPPRSTLEIDAFVASLAKVVILLPLSLAYLIPSTLCKYCSVPFWRAVLNALPYMVALTLVVLGFAVLPGLALMWQDRKVNPGGKP